MHLSIQFDNIYDDVMVLIMALDPTIYGEVAMSWLWITHPRVLW